MKKIKILHLTFNMSFGGTEQVIRHLVKYTDNKVYDVSIICLDNYIGELGKELLKNNTKITAFDRNTKGFDFRLVGKLHKYLIINKIDIIHCHQYTPYTYGLFASLWTDTAVIFTEHGRFYPDRFKWKRIILNRLLCVKTNAITAISKSTANALNKYENIPLSKIQIIYNGIAVPINNNQSALEIRNQLNIKQDSLILGTVSRLDPIKNQKLIIESFKNILIEYPQAILVIVGDGPLMSELVTYVENLNITTKVIFTGFKVNPYKYINIFDVFLLSSFSEGTSMTLLEAMAHSKPCVVTDVGGNSEIVINDITGYITPSNDLLKFTQSIHKLLCNTHLRKTMGESGRKRFETHFTVNQMIDSYQKLYISLKSN